MPRISDIAVLDQPRQFTLCVRTQTSVHKLPELIGDSYRRMSDHLIDLNHYLADVPFVHFHNLDLRQPNMQNLEVEIGFPVIATLPGKADIQPSILPAQRVIFCMYLGPYRDMEPVYEEMIQWVANKGRRSAGNGYEYHYNSSQHPANELLTKVVMPVG
ncbi:MAG: GyrI-like domain-containing protein [Xanthomonadaceae bacterium]|jgi:effector-binding domain-containing protein|nr:GyrI-like domain-containing protein [Xanthomonadaceae bacterium]